MRALEQGTTANTRYASRETQAAGAFDNVVKEATDNGRASPEQLAAALFAKAGHLPGEAGRLLNLESERVRRELTHVTYVGGLEGKAGVVGEFNGKDQSISIDQSQLYVGETGFSRMYEGLGGTVRHEIYHQRNEHGKALTPGASANGDTIVVMGGVPLTDEGMKEALNVIDVSPVPAYQHYVNGLLRATTNAHVGVAEVREAVNTKHNVSGLDDAARAHLQPNT